MVAIMAPLSGGSGLYEKSISSRFSRVTTKIEIYIK